MSELTLKLTMPVLEELAKRDEEFVVKLSHAAAREIGDRYSEALIRSEVVQKALLKLEGAIQSAQTEAGSKLEAAIGEWDNRVHTGYRLRKDVVQHIEQNFKAIIEKRFAAWIEANDIGAILDAAAKRYVDAKMTELVKKQVGEFLRRY